MTTPLDRFPAFLVWCNVSPRDKEGLARQQLREGIIGKLETECRDSNGRWLLSNGVTVHDVYLIGQWIEQMGGPGLPGALRIQ